MREAALQEEPPRTRETPRECQPCSAAGAGAPQGPERALRIQHSEHVCLHREKPPQEGMGRAVLKGAGPQQREGALPRGV